MEAFLGISAFYHDSAAALVVDGEIVCAAQEERFSRQKHDAAFPKHAVAFCLAESGLALDDLRAVVFYDKPWLKFERLLESYYAFAPRGLRQFVRTMPAWIKEKLFLRRLITQELQQLTGSLPPKLLFSEHHLAHMASAFFPSPFEQAAILTIDGVGEWSTATIAKGTGHGITLLQELTFPHSVGLLYSAFTCFLGFKVNSGEYKLMGLAPYGRARAATTLRYRDLIREHLVKIYPDGSIWLNQAYFDYVVGLHMIKACKWEQLFGLTPRLPESELTQEYCDFALAAQWVTEEIVLKMARTARALTDARYLCLAGGVALNCVANSHIRRAAIFDDIWIQPAAGDAGGALGAALAAWHIWGQHKRAVNSNDNVYPNDKMKGAYLGPQFDDQTIRRVLRRYRASYTAYQNFDELCRTVAALLDRGQIIGWFQGRMEWGPRALGNRSILADARHPQMQRKLNLKIKARECFRPFAPSVLFEDVGAYFQEDHASPYMLLVSHLQPAWRQPLPPNYDEANWQKKLAYQHSDLPAITHVDFSARLQTVHRQTNERYWRLLQAFKARTGCAVLLNTSFNVRGEPIVCTPEQAYQCFRRTQMDYLVLGDFLLSQAAQPPYQPLQESTFELD